jgi:hypothetical protein
MDVPKLLSQGADQSQHRGGGSMEDPGQAKGKEN